MYRGREKPGSHSERGEALGGGEGRATGRVRTMKLMTCTSKNLGFWGRKERKPESDSEESALQGTQEFQAFLTERTTWKNSFKYGHPVDLAVPEGAGLSLYFCPRKRKLSSSPVLLRIILGLGVKLPGQPRGYLSDFFFLSFFLFLFDSS